MSLKPSEPDVPTLNAVRLAGLVGGPLLAALMIGFVDLGNPVMTRTAAVAVLMAVWWMTEAVELAVTALVPLVAFPVLGVASGKTVASSYMNWIVFLFIGGFLIALAMERWNLHRRIALHILARSGSSPVGVLGGFMLATGFVSLWISNTAATMMMVPIGLAILTKWEEMTGRREAAFGSALMLGIAYAASIGGFGTLVGTPPNMTLVGIYVKSFPDRPPIDFGRFMMFAVPLASLLLAATWGWLAWRLRRSGTALSSRIDRSVVRGELAAMGRITRPELLVLLVAASVAVAWIFRQPLELGLFKLPGWSSWFSQPGYFDDGTVAIGFALLLFLIPTGRARGERLLDIKVFPQLPWGIVLLFGGGFALADAVDASGLSKLVGEQLAGLKGLPLPVTIAALCAIITATSELASNTAAAQIVLPVLAALAVELDVDPLLLMIPGTLACSLGFMLPVATPPNTIAFATGRIPLREMLSAGLFLDIIGITVGTALTLTWGRIVFGF